MTDTQAVAANIVAAWLAALSTGTDIKTVDTVVLRKRIAAALDASNNEIACLKNKIVELEANTASLLDARGRGEGMSDPSEEAHEMLDCQEPCPYGEACPICEPYWTRMELEGFWKNGEWTDKGIKEMVK